MNPSTLFLVTMLASGSITSHALAIGRADSRDGYTWSFNAETKSASFGRDGSDDVSLVLTCKGSGTVEVVYFDYAPAARNFKPAKNVPLMLRHPNGRRLTILGELRTDDTAGDLYLTARVGSAHGLVELLRSGGVIELTPDERYGGHLEHVPLEGADAAIKKLQQACPA
jgi:hypothetical protein